MSNPLSQMIADYISARLEAKLEASQKALSKAEAAENSAEIEKHNNKIIELRQQYQPREWLSNAAKRANQISLATHALKFTHSSAKGSNFLASFESDTPAGVIDSNILKNMNFDVVGNAASLDIAGLLELEVSDDASAQVETANTESLLSQIQQNDISAFLPFAESAEQAQQWLTGFQQALSNNELASHSLAKQVFFPVSDEEYHLLSPLHSSAMSQVIFDSVQHAKFSDEQKELRKARREQKPSDGEIVQYPNLARMINGGTKPQNVSKLNSGRGGITYLFPTTPPDILPPNDLPDLKKSIFDGRVIRQKTFRLVRDLSRFIAHNWDALNWNDSRKNRYQALIDDVADQVFEIGMLYRAKPANWTQLIAEEHRLELAEQHWLDPDQDHIEHLGETWRDRCAERFGTWLLNQLNHQLKRKNIVLDADEKKLYASSLDVLLNDLPNPKLFEETQLETAVLPQTENVDEEQTHD